MDGFQRLAPRSLFFWVMAFSLGTAFQARAQQYGPSTRSDASDDRIALENLLPPSVAETMDVNIWGWFSYLHEAGDDDSTYWLADISAGATKRFGDRLALTVDTHHERYDGSGYPNGLKGDSIPLCGRIVALADVYDALTSRRIYKAAFTHEVAFSMIGSEAGSHFDPAVVAAFVQNEKRFIEILERFVEIESEAA
jgi:hypothetical protein